MDKDYDWKPLIAATINQAVKDAKGKDQAKALDAVCWLVGEDPPFWVEAIGLPALDALKLVTSGRARKLGRMARER